MKKALFALLLFCPLLQADTHHGCLLYVNTILCNGHVATDTEVQALANPEPETYVGAVPPIDIRRDSNGRTHRSRAAKDEFKREYPCPSTGKGYGRCPGYVIDHIVPLACGGADSSYNMQWQTIAEGKAKDKTERKHCGGQ